MTVKENIARLTKDFIRFSIFAVIFIGISTAIATNNKPDNSQFKNGAVLESNHLNNMAIDWNQIYNKPSTDPTGSVCILRGRDQACPSWAPYTEGREGLGYTKKFQSYKYGDKGHGYSFETCCTE